MKKYLLLLFFIFALFPTAAFARIGVGVATGKVVVTQKLKPGIIYNLPPLTVINTGDVPSDYEVAVTYFETQSQLKPPNSWFIFSPQHFHLDPGKVQAVDIKLNLPIAVTPGDYFGFLEARPIQKSKVGQTTIGIAAAAKMYFTVVPANIFAGIYYKIISFWEVYAPWPQRFAIFIAIVIAILLARKHLNIQIGMKKPQATSSTDTEQEAPRRSRLKRVEELHKQDKKNE